MFHAVFCMFFVCCAIVFEIFLLYFVPVFFKLKQFCTPFGSKYPCGTKKTHSRRSALFLLLCSNLQRMSMKICHHNSILSLINSLILSLFTFPIQSPALAPLAVNLLLGDLPRTADRIHQSKVFLILYYGHGIYMFEIAYSGMISIPSFSRREKFSIEQRIARVSCFFCINNRKLFIFPLVPDLTSIGSTFISRDKM